MDVVFHRHVFHAWLEILAQGQHLATCLCQVIHALKHFLLAFTKSQHNARFGGDLRKGHHSYHLQAAPVFGPGTDLRAKPLHSLQVVGDHFGSCIDHQLHQLRSAVKIGDQRFHGESGHLLLQDLDGPDPEARALVSQVVPVHRGNHRMLNSHGLYGRGQPFRFPLIHRQGFPGLDCTELAGTGTYLPQNHKSSRPFPPALPDIGTVAAGADGMQLVLSNLLLHMHVAVPAWHAHPHPIGKPLPPLQVHLLLSLFHTAKIVRNMLNLGLLFDDMNKQIELLQLAKQVQALAENGLHFSESDWDLDRYTNLEEISLRMISLISGLTNETIEMATPERNGYRTPKVDIRCVIFNEKDEILMVKERVDSRWSLPGGWCDVGYTPTEVAEKEAEEEAGIRVKAGRLLAVFDKKCHDHPEDLFYSYKIFLECVAESFEIKTGMETLDVGFFAQDALPELSTPRNTAGQIDRMFDFRHNKLQWPLID